jgi:ribosomal protein S18 acetylase RimI-like enzyme
MGTFEARNLTIKGGTITVRHAVEADAESVLECAREVFATTEHTLTQPDEFTITLDQERAFLRERLESPTSVFLVATDGPLHVGAIVFSVGVKRKVQHHGEFGMGVRSTYRRRGVGRALLQSLIDWATVHPTIEMLRLGVYASNQSGLGLYKELGFVQYGFLPAGCRHDDGTYHDQIEMYRWVRS